MNRRIVLLGLACASLLLASGSGAFTAISADRSVEVSVVDDDEAFLAIPDRDLQCGNPPENTVVQNHFRSTLDSVVLSVAVPASADTGLKVAAKGGESPEELSPGGETDIHFPATGISGYAPGEGAVLQVTPTNGTTPDTVDIDVEASGGGSDVSVDDRQFDVDCANNVTKGNGGDGSAPKEKDDGTDGANQNP